ncbi:hypothetical protein [uncultured Sunxiuqinia sp.]|uniref:hypothetical protein n=1 Tax=uncultured Sunxiuqinia sp. TaxID=1573825 RepID=UPI00260919E3|nr:hypothetical protein [uncultured Sunxiuqinia sp.]
MNNTELLEEYSRIEKRIAPIAEFLEKHKNEKAYAGLYKGIITLNSPLVYQPEILFVGINAGEGAYIVENQKKDANNETPLRMLGEDQRCFEELNWFEDGNARGGPDHNRKWHSYKWYQRNKKTNNPFSKNMIDMLYEIAKLKYPLEYQAQRYDNDKLPFWFEGFGKSIMYTNLYPIATKDIKHLKQVHSNLSRETELQEHWLQIRKNDEKINEWTVRRFFIRRVYELIDLVKPKMIVVMGLSAYNDFLYKTDKGIILNTELKRNDARIPVIAFNRKGNWSARIPDIVAKIAEIECLTT